MSLFLNSDKQKVFFVACMPVVLKKKNSWGAPKKIKLEV